MRTLLEEERHNHRAEPYAKASCSFPDMCVSVAGDCGRSCRFKVDASTDLRQRYVNTVLWPAGLWSGEKLAASSLVAVSLQNARDSKIWGSGAARVDYAHTQWGTKGWRSVSSDGRGRSSRGRRRKLILVERVEYAFPLSSMTNLCELTYLWRIERTVNVLCRA